MPAYSEADVAAAAVRALARYAERSAAEQDAARARRGAARTTSAPSPEPSPTGPAEPRWRRTIGGLRGRR
jgi:hypothetical protein